MSGSTDVLSVVYIRTSHLKNTAPLFQEFTNIYKINHMNKVIEDLNVLIKYFRVRQEVSDEIQISISFIKDDLQTPNTLNRRDGYQHSKRNYVISPPRRRSYDISDS